MVYKLINKLIRNYLQMKKKQCKIYQFCMVVAYQWDLLLNDNYYPKLEDFLERNALY